MTPAAPLITDARTGRSHPGCYVAVANDCSSKLSNEHWLSANIIYAAGAGRAVTVSGMRWQAGKQHNLTAKSLGSNVLCERHNQALSPLDTVAGEIFHVLHHYQSDLRAPVDPHGNEFAFYSGDYLERWMLKLFWGGLAAGVLGRPDVPLRSLPPSADPKQLADFLFRSADLPDNMGLYFAARAGVPFSAEADVAIEPLAGTEGILMGGSVEFGAIGFRFFFGNPGTVDPSVSISRHPQGAFISDGSTERQKVLALGWDDGGTHPIEFTRLSDGTAERNPSSLSV